MNRRTLLLVIPATLLLVLFGAYVLSPKATAPIEEPVPTEETASTTEATETGAEAPSAEPAPIPDPVFATAKTENTVTATALVAPQTATMIVEGASFPIRVAEGSTVEEAMVALRSEGSISFTTRTYAGLGSFVKEINGKTDTNEYYWILHINGRKSAVGISQARISSGDVIEWKYEHKY